MSHLISIAVFHIESAAKQGRTIYYNKLATALGLNLAKRSDRFVLDQILREICRQDAENGHPLRTSIVVNVETCLPGPGYYKYAKSEDRLSSVIAMQREVFARFGRELVTAR